MTTAMLTREQILALPAGRELDVLVAEKVMGLELFYDRYGYAYFKGDHGLLGNRTPPDYSTDIAAAWQVVEKFKDSWSLMRYEPVKGGMQFCCQLEDGTTAYGETATLAICRAALLAVVEK